MAHDIKIAQSKTMSIRLEQFLSQRFANDIVNHIIAEMIKQSVRLTHDATTEKIMAETTRSEELKNLFKNKDAVVFYSHTIREIINSNHGTVSMPDIIAMAISIANHSCISPTETILHDPYIRRLKEKLQSSDSNIKMYNIQPYTLQKLDSAAYDKTTCITTPQICYFTETIAYPVYTDRQGKIKATVSLQDIAEMNKQIHTIKGNIALFGLGVGYQAYMLSEKDSVSSITIVENDEETISSFEKTVLPICSHPEKIKIIQTDPYKYINNMSDGSSHFAIFCNHDTSNDLEQYLKLKTICKRFKSTKTIYWFEQDHIELCRDWIVTRILQSAEKVFHVKKPIAKIEPDLPYVNMFLDKICDKITISRPSDIAAALSSRNIQNMINKTTIPKSMWI